jgi:hypothetical protein
MNTYTVAYFPPGVTSAPVPLSQEAADWESDGEWVLFFDDSTPKQVVLAVPLRLNPIITRGVPA